ncbi:MAG TPA: UDP-N-acetylmuramoyl-tripeptide--D-alanyl-D-alanine ligase [Paenibacillaceae bacterium]|nr:UDP-N-acetylmuramoyl-tripeptide--D-alanyl-D-alanine ligase [Paenibacillaceae bacterium]
MMFTINEIVQITGGTLLQGNRDTRITSVHFDSRQLNQGGLFVALTSGTRDGHDFLPATMEKGIAGALISRKDVAELNELDSSLALVLVEDTEKGFQDLARTYRNQLQIPFIAITGSNGKTTTKDITAHLLEGKYKVYKTYKNFNNHLGVPLSILQITPETEVAVLELGMNHEGEIDLLAGIVKPDYSVITNVNDAHMEYFESREKIALAKGELLGHTNPNGFACLNQDNPYVANLAHLNPGKTYFYHVSQQDEQEGAADITASNLYYDEQGSHYTVTFDHQQFSCVMPLYGEHNISNTLPGIFIALHLGITPEQIKERLEGLEISAMRFQQIQGVNGLLIINDAYNASPTSMKASVSTFLTVFKDRDKVIILGDMFELGEQSDAYHREVGEALNEMDGDFKLVTIGNLSKEISDAYFGESIHFLTKDEALEYLNQFKSKEYAILLKASRGMKLETLLDKLM